MTHPRLAEIFEIERIDNTLVAPLLNLFTSYEEFQLSFFDMPLVIRDEVPELNWLPKKIDRYKGSISSIIKSLENIMSDAESISRTDIEDFYEVSSKLNLIIRNNKKISKIIDQIMTEINEDFGQITSKIPSPHKYRCPYYYEYNAGEVKKIFRSVSVQSELNRGSYHFSLARNSTAKRLVFFSNIQVASLVGRGCLIEGSIIESKVVIRNVAQTWIS